MPTGKSGLDCSAIKPHALARICLLHCTAQPCTAQHCTAQPSPALHCTALHCPAQHSTAQHCIAHQSITHTNCNKSLLPHRTNTFDFPQLFFPLLQLAIVGKRQQCSLSLSDIALLQIMPGTQLPSGMVTPLHGRATAGSRPLSSQSDATPSATRCPLLSPLFCPLFCPLLVPFVVSFPLPFTGAFSCASSFALCWCLLLCPFLCPLLMPQAYLFGLQLSSAVLQLMPLCLPCKHVCPVRHQTLAVLQLMPCCFPFSSAARLPAS